MIGPMSHARAMKATFALAAFLAATACGDASDPVPGGRGPDQPAERVSGSATQSASSRASKDEVILPDPVELEDAVLPLSLNVYSKSGYWSSDRTLMIDVMEGDLVYATAMIADARGLPVRGVHPTVVPMRDSQFVPMADDAAGSRDLGNYRFGLRGGTMGEERVGIVLGDARVSLLLNVISERASGFGWLADLEGVLDWRLLREADVTWGDEQVSATFPEEIRARSGQTVKLVGFVMPLEATLEQTHFLLTSSPPGCFFHVPGGAAGAVEVFASKPLSLGFEPVVFEGRFEALETSDVGVIYRLHDARALDPPRRSREP